jgi:hypothetical protein
MITKEFKAAIRLSDRRAYKIAHEAGLHPSTLSKIVCGIEKVKPGDPRVLKVGKILGLTPGQCFCHEDKEDNARAN